MGRPPTPVGTYGVIKTTNVAPGVWEAHARFRMPTGRSKPVRRRGKTKTAAVNRLKEALTRLADEARGGQVTGDTRFAAIAQLWLDEIRREYALSGKPGSTVRLYSGYVKNWVVPALGELQAREVTAMGCNTLVQRARDKSYETAKSVRAVLSGICSFAVRAGAMDTNPVKSTARLARGETKAVKAMTLEQRRDLVAKLEALAEAKTVDSKGRSLGTRSQVWQALPDIVRAMLSTGVRLGELLALDGADVDPIQKTVTVGHHIVRVPKEGLLRAGDRKGGEPSLILLVPEWSVPMWRRRKLASGGGPLFPSWNREWSDPSNVIKRIREAFDECGYDWVTSHVFRKTVTTVLDEADLPTTAIADQLGNTPAVVEKHYRKKRASNAATLEALEGMFPEEGAG
ncbi:tyrosine-type recombinase/integrase [Amycolatopsis palatopharyngis]|uniref:tyrosine-type recombinase/integrase n=1 Tax=Amycolatopsis palatopharyngis TaxID=187982 RepID=UPI000E26E934|nr:tyrosine-type recombinase/integrase [Amycolatopsis palatopharyngis]